MTHGWRNRTVLFGIGILAAVGCQSANKLPPSMQPTKDKSSTTPISTTRAPATSSRLSSNPNLVASQLPPDNSSFAPLGPPAARTNPAVMSQPATVAEPNGRIASVGTGMPALTPEPLALKPGIQNLLPPEPPGPSAGGPVSLPSALPITAPSLPSAPQPSGVLMPASVGGK